MTCVAQPLTAITKSAGEPFTRSLPARKEGRPHGRPRTASLKADEIRRLKAERVSHSEIARRLGIGRTSVRRILAAG